MNWPQLGSVAIGHLERASVVHIPLPVPSRSARAMSRLGMLWGLRVEVDRGGRSLPFCAATLLVIGPAKDRG